MTGLQVRHQPGQNTGDRSACQAEALPLAGQRLCSRLTPWRLLGFPGDRSQAGVWDLFPGPQPEVGGSGASASRTPNGIGALRERAGWQELRVGPAVLTPAHQRALRASDQLSCQTSSRL